MARVRDNSKRSFIFDEYACGFHVYRDVWEPEPDEILEFRLDKGNVHDKHAIGIFKNGALVGHAPRGVARYCSKAILLGAVVTFQVKDGTYCNLRHNGLEVGGTYQMHGRDGYLEVIIRLLKDFLRRSDTANT